MLIFNILSLFVTFETMLNFPLETKYMVKKKANLSTPIREKILIGPFMEELWLLIVEIRNFHEGTQARSM